jgi:predicted phage tail protein
VPDTAQFVTCNHCATQLRIQRTSDVTFTEQLDRLAQQTEQLSERINELSAQNEVAAIDREWELERENYMVTDKNKGRHIPTRAGSLTGGIVVTVFGCFWTAMAFGITSFMPFPVVGTIFPLFGVVFVIFGIVTTISAYSKAEAYEDAHRRYQRRRSELLNQDRSDRHS